MTKSEEPSKCASKRDRKSVKGAASKRELGRSLRTSINKKRVQAKLRLSKKARNAPLPSIWLSTMRDFLTRRGKWKQHPVRSVEHLIASPAPGVVAEPRVLGGLTERVAISTGFGNMAFEEGKLACGTHMCEALSTGPMIEEQVCQTLFCGVLHAAPEFNFGDDAFWCITYSSIGCPVFRVPCIVYCGGDDCPCYGYPSPYDVVPDPGQLGPYEPLIQEFEANWDHPFVIELRDYLGVKSAKKLFQSVAHYVGRNMYAASAL